METQVYNFHDDDGQSVGIFRLNAGKYFILDYSGTCKKCSI